MKRALRSVISVLAVAAALFIGFVLYLGKPRPDEPELSKRMRLKMWMWGEALALLGYGLWHPHLLLSGATREEKQMGLPGDNLVSAANSEATYGITINANPEEIWPWLVQMGDGRASWYAWSPAHTYPEYRHQVSPYNLNPAWQDLKVGQILMDGDVRDDCNEGKGAWRVVEIVDCKALVFYSARDFVEGIEFDPELTRPDRIYGITSWGFYILPASERESRLLIRVRAELGPRALVPVAKFVFGNYDRVWERTILEGVKYRAENCGNRVMPAA